MKQKLVYFLTLIALVLVTGTFWGTWFTLTRSLEDFSADEFIHIGKTIIANVAVPMRIIMPLAILLTLLSLWWHPRKRTAGFYCMLTSLLLLIITLLITVVIEVPIDNQIKQWTPASIPTDWEDIRARWQVFHALRTLTSVIGFACFCIAVLADSALCPKQASTHSLASDA